MAYVFIDESGQFNQHNREKYFVVASFTIGDPRRTQKRFSSWQKTKFPRKMRNQSEIKFSEVNIDDKLRLKTLKLISSLDVRIRYVYLFKKNIPANYVKKRGGLQSGFLYTNIIGEILEMYLPCVDKEFRVFCDQRHLKGIKRSEFKNILTARLLPKLPRGIIFQIEMIDSIANKNIQIADWICGAIASCLENKKLGKEFYQIIVNNILGEGRELFKNDKK
ncbi:MAG: DUF3800 domain-containing protein [Candidatus Pacebacteria bacterium]|nr:DUF3800 domain-containing protein [Candidatus Paceibacterota bacterium]